MNSIVISVNGSKINFLGLRFVLRSIEKNIKNLGNVVIVGDKPDWIKNVDYIGVSDEKDKRFELRNTLKKIQSCCLSSKVTEDFMFIDGSVIFLKQRNNTYPYVYSGPVFDPFKSTQDIAAKRTSSMILNRGLSGNNFDIGRPIVFNKKKFTKTFNIKDINFETPYGYKINTIYCSFNKIIGDEGISSFVSKSNGYELSKEILRQRIIININDRSLLGGMDEALEEMFPEKSKFEI